MKSPIVERISRCLLLSLSSRITIYKRHESKLGFRTQLSISDLAELTEELLKLLFGSLRLYILHDKVEHLHRFLELVSTFDQLKLPLLLSLCLSNVETRLLVGFFFVTVTSLTELINSFLSILPVFEANETESFAHLVLVFHDDSAHNLTKVTELCFKLLIRILTCRKVLYIQIGAAARFLEASSVLLWDILTYSKHTWLRFKSFLLIFSQLANLFTIHLFDGILGSFKCLKLDKAISTGLIFTVNTHFD
jgi:hypothetical protein